MTAFFARAIKPALFAAAALTLSGCSKIDTCKVPVIYDFELAEAPSAEDIATCLSPSSFKTPSSRAFAEPRHPSPWQLCSGPLKGRSQDEIYQCADQAFWESFSDGRLEQRVAAEKRMSEALNLLQDWDESEKLARAHFLRGALRLAMSLENGKVQYAVLNNYYVGTDMRRAVELDPDGIAAPAFLNALNMANAAIFKRWNTASSLANAAIDDAYHVGIGAAFAIGGNLLGFPLTSGIPARTVTMMEEIPCDQNFCTDNTKKAPFSVPGLAFHQAEGYARIGDKAGLLHWLDVARNAPGYEEWYFNYIVEAVAADPDSFLQKFAQYGESGAPYMEVYANSNFGCVFCHGRM
ncbi:MAG TPA: hypothetical protein VM553_02870 [Dongiaceae bacterium]|nr:hypothetical protein [Dongiaceae bacterium]